MSPIDERLKSLNIVLPDVMPPTILPSSRLLVLRRAKLQRAPLASD
jgi:hypothetical protein